MKKEPKLYRVSITSEVFVVANCKQDAEQYALRESDVVNDAMEHADATASVVTVKSLSRDEEVSLPWVDPWVDDDLEDGEVDRDRTVKAWAELNAAATDQAKREREFHAKQLNIPGA